MSRDYTDEFVIFPGSKHHTVKLDIKQSGSHDPTCCNESGRQHRPAGPEHDALRYDEDIEIRNTLEPGHEKEPSVVNIPAARGRPPGTPVKRPGKPVDHGPRVGPECSAPVAAMLRVTSALRRGWQECGRPNESESTPTDSLVSAPPPATLLQCRQQRGPEFNVSDDCGRHSLLQYRPTPGLEYCHVGDMECHGQSGDVAASHSAGRAYCSAAHPGPDKVRVEEVNDSVGAVSHTLPRQLPVYSGENVILPEDSLSDISVLDMEVEQDMSEFEVQKSVQSGEALNQPLNYGQREVGYSLVSMDVCSQNSLCPGVVSAQSPVASACPDLSVVNEVSEASRNPSSRSTLPMTEEVRSDSPVLRTAVEARTKLENVMGQARSLVESPLSVFRPVEFESTPVSSYPYRSYVRSEAIPEVTQNGKHTGYSRLDDEVLVRNCVSGQPVRVTPRQPYGQSLFDPAAPTRVFGSTGQREVTVVKRG